MKKDRAKPRRRRRRRRKQGTTLVLLPGSPRVAQFWTLD